MTSLLPPGIKGLNLFRPVYGLKKVTFFHVMLMKMTFFLHYICFNYTSGKTLSVNNHCHQTPWRRFVFLLCIQNIETYQLLNFYFESFYIWNELTLMVFLHKTNGTTNATEVSNLFFLIIFRFLHFINDSYFFIHYCM